MVLWLSSAAHTGGPPTKRAKATRNVLYVCQKPRFRLPTGVRHDDGRVVPLTSADQRVWQAWLEQELYRKRSFFPQCRMTTHVPDEIIVKVTQMPRAFLCTHQHVSTANTPILHQVVAPLGSR